MRWRVEVQANGEMESSMFCCWRHCVQRWKTACLRHEGHVIIVLLKSCLNLPFNKLDASLTVDELKDDDVRTKSMRNIWIWTI